MANPTVQAQEFALQINGVKFRETGKLSQLAASSVDADNEPGKEPVVNLVEGSVTALSNKVQVPPISVSVYEFDVENG